jgi:hypothetical protein
MRVFRKYSRLQGGFKLAINFEFTDAKDLFNHEVSNSNFAKINKGFDDNVALINANTTKINANTTKINANIANINNLTTAVDLNTTKINDNNSRVDSLTIKVDDFKNVIEPKVLANATAIINNSALITANANKINSNSALIATNKTDIAKNKNDILDIVNNKLPLKANIASPNFLGVPTAPTAGTTVNNTQIATTAFVKTAVASKAPILKPIFETEACVDLTTAGDGWGYNLKDSTGTKRVLTGFKNNANGMGVGYGGGGGLTMVAGGESLSAFVNTIKDTNLNTGMPSFGTETVELLADSDIRIWSNLQSGVKNAQGEWLGQLVSIRNNDLSIEALQSSIGIKPYTNGTVLIQAGISDKRINTSTKGRIHFVAWRSTSQNLAEVRFYTDALISSTALAVSSDRRVKKDIAPLDDNIKNFIMSLNPVGYHYIDGMRTHFGLIAQEVETAMHDNGLNSLDFAGLVINPVFKDIETGEFEISTITNKKGEIIDEEVPITKKEIVDTEYALRYEEFIAPLIKIVQEQQKEIDELKLRLKKIENTQ